MRLATLFDRHHRMLYRLALRLLGDPTRAEDAVQDCFVKVAIRLERVPSTEKGEEAWLVRVVVNLCRDRRRRLAVRDRYAKAQSVEGPRLERAPDQAAIAKLTLDRGLDELPMKRRAVLVLRELEGWEVAGIAKALGVSKATVRWHLAAARRDLERVLGGIPARQGVGGKRVRKGRGAK